MSRRMIVAALAAVLAGGSAAWLLVSAPDKPTSPSSISEQADKRKRFFGGDPDKNVRNGPEMKPQW